jgi:hypothetical protein
VAGAGRLHGFSHLTGPGPDPRPGKSPAKPVHRPQLRAASDNWGDGHGAIAMEPVMATFGSWPCRGSSPSLSVRCQDVGAIDVAAAVRRSTRDYRCPQPPRLT